MEGTNRIALDRAWVEGANPFKLPRPADWWLQQMLDYDFELVLMPAIKDCCYRLCRRPNEAIYKPPALAAELHGHPDTIQMARFGLLPLSTVAPWAVRSDRFLRDLAGRDLWAAGKGVVDDIEYREELARRKQDRETSEKLDYVNNEAYRSLQYRKGARVSRFVGRAIDTAVKFIDRRRVRLDTLDHKSVISGPSPDGASSGPTIPGAVAATESPGVPPS